MASVQKLVQQLTKSGQAGPTFFTAVHEGQGLAALRQELDGKVLPSHPCDSIASSFLGS